MEMDLELEGKVALITGAAGGIGAATARVLAAEGVNVVVHYLSSENKAKKLANEIGDNTLCIKADLSCESQALNMFKEIEEKKGRIDILICNAAIYPDEYLEIEKIPLERWKNTLAINLDSVFLCCRSFIQQLRKFDGDSASIVIVGSTSGIFGEAGHADYSTAKSAITFGLTRSLKNEIINVVRLGRVNAVCPGWTVSPMSEKYLDDEDGIKHVLKTVPLKKIAEAEDIANVIAVLVSDKVSGHISGEVITIAGGMEGRALHLPEEIDFSKAYKRKG
jgi:3-oxoacyl-[acyl-carrier protein] reductase